LSGSLAFCICPPLGDLSSPPGGSYAYIKDTNSVLLCGRFDFKQTCVSKNNIDKLYASCIYEKSLLVWACILVKPLIYKGNCYSIAKYPFSKRFVEVSLIIILSIWNIPPKTHKLNVWSLAGGTVLEGSGNFRSLAGGSCSLVTYL
jgi:hypothetical protein